MPLTPPGLIGPILSNLVSTGHIGIATPQLAAGVAAGVMYWSPLVTVISVGAGTLGVGVGIIPFVVPPPLLLGSMAIGFASSALIGIFSPLTIVGLSTGLALGLIQGLVLTIHPTVGLGAGVCKFVAPPAGPLMLAGFASVGLIGLSAIQLANAIGMALDLTLLALVLPTPILGPPSILPGAGVGIGKLV